VVDSEPCELVEIFMISVHPRKNEVEAIKFFRKLADLPIRRCAGPEKPEVADLDELSDAVRRYGIEDLPKNAQVAVDVADECNPVGPC
jgi:hypothetical protein